jgi:hypothetical protein
VCGLFVSLFAAEFANAASRPSPTATASRSPTSAPREIGDQKPVTAMVNLLEMIAVDPDGLARAHTEAERVKGVGLA